jgi:hypothetical protein
MCLTAGDVAGIMQCGALGAPLELTAWKTAHLPSGVDSFDVTSLCTVMKL